MKKLFLLIPALVLSLMVKAADQYPDPAVDNSLATAVNAVGTGETIYLDEGIYTNSDASDYTKIRGGKNITFKAIEGKNPVVQLKYAFQIREASSAKFMGIKFDGTNLAYDSYFLAYDATDNTWEFEDCEFTALSKYVIQYGSDKKVASVVFNKCYFHDITKSCIYIDNTGEANLTVRNSTFANIDASAVSAGMVESKTATGAVLVDHCTFYNCKVKNTDYGTIKVASPNATVSNCIFAMPTSTDDLRTVYVPSGLEAGTTVTHCIMHNYTKDSNIGIPSRTGLTKEECNAVDPLFNDLANNKYTFAGDWTTMTLSPARGAATDGSDLGDPRWYTDPVLPSTDFASPYQLLGAKAILAGNIWYDDTNDYLYGDGGHNQVYGTATWKIHATRACQVEVALNLNSGNTSGHKLRVEVLDADGNSIGEFAEEASTLPGTLAIPAIGNYTIILHEDQTWSSAMIDNITLSYVGGEVQNMPGTTNIADAWFSANGTRADGKITYTSISSGCWAKWNINVASAGTYNVIVNIQNVYGHNYAVEFLKEGEITPISIDEGGTTYGNDATLYPVEVGAVTLEPGNYEMKVSNAIGDAALLNVTLAYAGGAAVELSKTTPASLLANADAILSNDWTIEAGQIYYSESKATTGWAKWNVNCADYGNYTMTVNISSDNGHGMRVEVFEDEAQPAIYTLDEPTSGKYHTGDLALDLGNIILSDREYVVKITNTVSSSHAKITSIVITYLNGSQATLPATFNFEDGMLSEKAHITAGELWFNEIGDSNPVGQWAKWNVKVAEAGIFLFTMNVSSTNGQSYKISILDGETEIDAFESGSVGSGDQTVKHYFNLAVGNYTVKLENTYPWSQGHIVSLAVTQPSLLVLDEAVTDNTIIHNNYRNGTHDIQITRTIVSGMYNSICLPFDVNSAQLQAIFGSDVELLQMASTTLNGSELDLNFDAVTSIYRGTPYLIKTSKTVANPVFVEVEIKEETGQATSTDIVDFIGSFIKSEVPAGEDNLFLGPNDLLYFSSSATPIKGMRAWFKVKVPNPQHVIQHARIVKGEQVITSINFIDGNMANETVKTIENGQLVIIRDGVRYNAMGIRLQ